MRFPSGFLWGTATAAHQVEGGNVNSDTYNWEVWHGDRPFEAYQEHRSRFVSEFGFQSLPPWRPSAPTPTSPIGT